MIKLDLSKTGIDAGLLEKNRNNIKEIIKELVHGVPDHSDMTGWVSWCSEIGSELPAAIKQAAASIRSRCSLFLVSGIGGSYLGAKAVIEALGAAEGSPDVVFVGNNMCTRYHAQILKRVEAEDVCLCCISKSGGTLEPNISYQIFKSAMEKKYGKGNIKDRVFVITGNNDSELGKEAISEGYTMFGVPEYIGGRYSVFTAVGLLPIAVAGLSIDELLRGAASVSGDLFPADEWYGYASARFEFMKEKSTEIFEFFNPSMSFTGEWIKQLCAESEGKSGSGLFPASLVFSTDLHSIEQYLQDGKRIFFETMVIAEKLGDTGDIPIPDYPGSPVRGLTMNAVNRCIADSVISAHSESNIPMVLIRMPVLNEYYLGQLMLMFMMTVAVTGKMAGVNPFDQPGVEKYKSELNTRLRKTDGYAE